MTAPQNTNVKKNKMKKVRKYHLISILSYLQQQANTQECPICLFICHIFGVCLFQEVTCVRLDILVYCTYSGLMLENLCCYATIFGEINGEGGSQRDEAVGICRWEKHYSNLAEKLTFSRLLITCLHAIHSHDYFFFIFWIDIVHIANYTRMSI